MKNRLKYACAGILPLLAIADSASATEHVKEQKERPNILFILSDDHTSQTWGIYGGILADTLTSASEATRWQLSAP